MLCCDLHIFLDLRSSPRTNCILSLTPAPSAVVRVTSSAGPPSSLAESPFDEFPPPTPGGEDQRSALGASDAKRTFKHFRPLSSQEHFLL